jgi:hypothetical protein
LGWISPVALYDVQLRDEHDELLARAEKVEGTGALWRLLVSPRSPGRFRILRPELRLTIDADETNLERLLASLEDQSSSANCPALEIELIDGVLAIEDSVTQRHWQMESIHLLTTLARDWSQPLQLRLDAKLPQPDRSGALNVELKLDRSLDRLQRPSHSGQLQIKCDAFPLVVAEPLLRRRWRRLELDGWLNIDGQLSWEADETGLKRLAVQGDTGAEQLRLNGPLGHDELRLASLKAPCRASLDGRKLKIEKFAIDCDIGQAEFVGPANLTLDALSPAKLWETLASETYEFTGEVDLARVASLLPATIRIREETRITAGRITWQLSSRLDDGRARWQGRLESSNLVGETADRRWTWQKPMLVTFAAHEAQGLVVDKLQCQSNFLQIEAAGKRDQMSGWATFDLNLLAAELGQFLDLGHLQMAGDGWTYLDWKRHSEGRFQADGELQLREFQLAAPGRRPWQEKHLLTFFSLTGQADDEGLQEIQKADLKLESKPDTLLVELREGMTDFTANSTWPLQVEASGDLATWLARLEPWLGDLSGWDLEGKANLEATLDASRDRIGIESASCRCEPLRIASARLNLEEPRAELELKGTVGRMTQQARLDSLQFEASGLSLEAKEVNVSWAPGQLWQSSGAATFTGELAKWQEWTADASDPALWKWSGQIEGELQATPLNEAGGGSTATLNALVQNLTGTCPQREPWREPRVELSAAVRYLRGKEALVLDRLEAASQIVSFEAAGQVADVRGRRDLSLKGQFEYEPQQLLAMLRPYVGDKVEINAAREARPFSVQGPLAALASSTDGEAPAERIETLYREFTAEAAAGWVGADVYGFRVGSGEVRGRLADGLLNLSPLNLAVSEGRLTSAPRIRLWPEPAQLEVDSGPLLANVRISPQMCDAGLQYIAPVLAGVTQAQGSFSIALDGCRVPLDHPDRGDLGGQFTVHSVEIGPGPLVRELATLLERPGVARLSKESVVPFRMVQGRVYHRDLELVFPELTIRTHGSVGLDRTLAIMAEMPVPPKWIGNNPLGTAMRNQTIRLPIGGTLNEPTIDPKALAQVSGDFLKAGARNLLLDGLNRGLDRLFKPPEN